MGAAAADVYAIASRSGRAPIAARRSAAARGAHRASVGDRDRAASTSGGGDPADHVVIRDPSHR